MSENLANPVDLKTDTDMSSSQHFQSLVRCIKRQCGVGYVVGRREEDGCGREKEKGTGRGEERVYRQAGDSGLASQET